MGGSYLVIEDGVIPEWLQQAYQDGKTIQIMSSIGWLDLDGDIEFRNNLEYRVKP